MLKHKSIIMMFFPIEKLNKNMRNHIYISISIYVLFKQVGLLILNVFNHKFVCVRACVCLPILKKIFSLTLI